MSTLLDKPDSHDLGGHTVLIVDDDPANLSVISDYLAGAGLEVLIARDGESGLQKARYARPNIILLDVVMPGIDGFEACRRLKTDEQTKDIPVLFMTALTSTRDRVKAYEVGAMDYVTKPIQVAELLARVRAHLSLHDMTRHLAEQEAQVQQAIARREEADTALQVTEARLRALIDQIPFDLWAADTDLRYILQNATSRQQYGNLIGKRIEELNLPAELKAQWIEKDYRVLQGETLHQDYETRSGSEKRSFESIAAPVIVGEVVVGIVGTAMDVTERKQVEEELRRYREHLEEVVAERTAELSEANQKLTEEIEARKRVEVRLNQTNRMLKILSECNQTVVRATDEAGLLQKICRVMTELGGYSLVWVGFAEHDAAQSVRPVARLGFRDDYVDTVNATWADTDRGPIGTAIRTGQPAIVNDIQTDPSFEPWRTEASQRGYASAIALPLNFEGRTLGTLNIYAAQPNAFHAEEVKLLMELAGDLAYGIISLRTRAERQQAETALAEQHHLLRTLIDAMPDRIYVKDTDSRFLLANDMVAWVMGTTPEEAIGKRDFDFFPQELAEQYYADEQALLASGQALIDREEREVDLAGNVHWISTTKVPFRDEQGKLKGFVGIGRDITVRKEMEYVLRQARDELEARVEERTAELKTANKQLAALYRVGQIITAPLQLHAVLNAIAYHTVELLGSDTGVILLLDDAGETLTIKGAYGLSQEVIEGTRDRIGESIAGRVAQTGQPIIANDLPNNARFDNPSAGNEGLLACASVPLSVGGRIIGTLDVHSKVDRNAFNEEHIRILSLLASQAAIAIENARLYGQLQQAHAELEVRVQQRTAELVTANAYLQQEIVERQKVEQARAAFYRISEAAQAAQNLDALFGSIHAIVGELMPAKNFYIALYEVATNLFSFPYHADELDLTWAPAQPGQGLTEYVLRTGKPLLATPQVFEQLVQSGQVKLVGSPSIDWLGVPLKTQRGETIGVMAIQTYTETIRFSEADLNMLVFVSTQVAMTIERKQAEEREHHLTRNLRAMVEAVDELIACPDLDTFFRRAVELAREKLNVERSAIFLLDPMRQCMLGTYGTDRQGHTTDERHATLPPGVPAVLLNPLSKLWLMEEREHSYWDGDQIRVFDKGWVVTTVIRIGDEPIGTFSNDTAISHAPLDEVTQETIAIYCSLLGNIIKRKRADDEVRRRATQLEAINAIISTAATAADLPELLEIALDRTLQAFALKQGSIWVADQVVQRNLPVEVSPTMMQIASMIGTDLSSAIAIPNWQTEAIDGNWWAVRSQMVQFGILASVVAPIPAKDQRIGGLAVASAEPRVWSREDVALVEAIGRQLGATAERLRLLQEVRQQADELAAVVARLQEMDRLKNEFIQNTSHELRTPIGIIRGYAELLETNELGELQPDQLEPIRIIARRARMLGNLVEDITAILEMETQAVTREPMDMAQLVRAMVDEFQIAAKRAELALTAEIESSVPEFYGDTVALRRVLDNLVSNAFKFTKAGGRVTLRLRLESGTVVLEVADTGIGIPSDKLERVFDRFYQVDGSATRHYGGMGLGLALVKEVVKAHGGQINVTSQVGVGTTFTITLPVAETWTTP